MVFTGADDDLLFLNYLSSLTMFGAEIRGRLTQCSLLALLPRAAPISIRENRPADQVLAAITPPLTRSTVKQSPVWA